MRPNFGGKRPIPQSAPKLRRDVATVKKTEKKPLDSSRAAVLSLEAAGIWFSGLVRAGGSGAGHSQSDALKNRFSRKSELGGFGRLNRFDFKRFDSV